MSTIVRVKRHLEEDPLEALVINLKRKKLSDADNENVTTIFKFAGTLDKPESPLRPILLKTKESKVRLPLKQREVNITEKLKESIKNTSKTNRLKIINCFRTGDDSAIINTEDLDDFAIVEVHPAEPKPEAPYVFDIYLTENAHVDDFNFDNLESVEPLEDLVYGQYRDSGDVSSDDSQDDSNDENNWRNEYPDSPDSDMDDEDILDRVNNCKIDDDLSSTDDERIHYGDVESHGKKYAEFRSRFTHDEDEFFNADEYFPDSDEGGNDRDEYFDSNE